MIYNYEVISVDSENGTMEVKYSASGKNPVHVSARLPEINTDLLDVIKAYAPTPIWEQESVDRKAVDVGISGTVDTDDQSHLTYKELRAAEYPIMEYYLDGVVKNDQAQIQKYIDDCLAVKAKYPKPE